MVGELPQVGDVLLNCVVVDVQVINGHTLITVQGDEPLEEASE